VEARYTELQAAPGEGASDKAIPDSSLVVVPADTPRRLCRFFYGALAGGWRLTGESPPMEIEWITVPDERMPSLEGPDDKDCYHLRRPSDRAALCGAKSGGHKTGCSLIDTPYAGETTCPDCGRRLCPTCAHMADVELRTGLRP
jgi:hypothetical protein